MQLANEVRPTPDVTGDRWVRGASAFSIPGVLSGVGAVLYWAEFIDISTLPRSLTTLVELGRMASLIVTLFAPLSTLVAVALAATASAPPRAGKRALARTWLEVGLGIVGTLTAWAMLLKQMRND